MTDLFLRDITADLTPSTLFNLSLELSPGTRDEFPFSLSGQQDVTGYGFGPEVGNVQGEKPATVFVEIFEGSSDVWLYLRLSRVSVSGTVLQQSLETSPVQALSGAVYDAVWSSPGLGTWGPTNRLRVDYRFENTSGQQRDITIRVNHEFSRVVIPYTPENKWSGAPSQRRIRAGVGAPKAGPLVVGTYPPNYGGQTDFNFGPIFYSEHDESLGDGWLLAQGTGSGTGTDANAWPTAREWETGLCTGLLEGQTPTVTLWGNDPYEFERAFRARHPDNAANTIDRYRTWQESTSLDYQIYASGYSDPRFGGSGVFKTLGSNFTVAGADIGSRRVLDLAYNPGDDLWVGVVGSGTSYITSQDSPEDWSLNNRNGPQWNCIVYSVELGMFVVGCTTGEIETSTNGSTWTSRSEPSPLQGFSRNAVIWIPSKTYSKGARGLDVGTVTIPGRFVMVGGSGAIIYSYDGIEWFSASNVDSNTLNRIAWADQPERLFAGGLAGHMRQSSDWGENWSGAARVPQVVNLDTPTVWGATDNTMGWTRYDTSLFQDVPRPRVHGGTLHVRALIWKSIRVPFFIIAGPRVPRPDLVSKTQTTIEIEWADVQASSYDVRRAVVNKHGEYSWSVTATGLTGTSYEFTGLSPGTTYALAVRGADGDWSTYLLAQTVIEEIAPSLAPSLYLLGESRSVYLLTPFTSSSTSVSVRGSYAKSLLESVGVYVEVGSLPIFKELGTPFGGRYFTDNFDAILTFTTSSFGTATYASYNSFHADPDEAVGYVGVEAILKKMNGLTMAQWNAKDVYGLSNTAFIMYLREKGYRADGHPYGARFSDGFALNSSPDSIVTIGLEAPPGVQHAVLVKDVHLDTPESFVGLPGSTQSYFSHKGGSSTPAGGPVHAFVGAINQSDGTTTNLSDQIFLHAMTFVMDGTGVW